MNYFTELNPAYKDDDFSLDNMVSVDAKSAGVVRLAFQMATDDDLTCKNPFDFQLATLVVNDSVTRDAISRADMRKFLKFVEEDKHFTMAFISFRCQRLHHMFVGTRSVQTWQSQE